MQTYLSTLIAGIAFAPCVFGQVFDPQLVGTWSTKSNRTFTGPGFYNPMKEQFFEPEHTGISYSFTDDGFYEEAYYRALSNPTQPQCPKGMIQWQHGRYEKAANGSLLLEPIAVDGRQLISDPCKGDSSILMRYNQSELFERYEVFIDPYHNIPRLNLFKFDGSPMNPMYLAFRPPEMLPTQTLNPITSATGGAAATGSSKFKRGLPEEFTVPRGHQVLTPKQEPINTNRLWWLSLGMTVFGAFLYFCF